MYRFSKPTYIFTRLLLTLVLALTFANAALAQSAAPGVPAETAATTPAPAQSAAPVSAIPADIAKKLDDLDKATKNAQMSGDNSWMLTSAALVLMMTGPGLALFYG